MSNGWPNKIQECPLKLQPYWNYRNDITEVESLLLYRSRIIIPSELRKDILERIHSGHLGMDKCKRRARDSVFWPGLTNQIEQRVRKCESCIKFAPSKKKEAMLSHTVSTRPWQKIASDILRFAGKDYIILVDYYSLWPEVFLLNRANTTSVIEAFKDSFARHGIPEVLVSDNGPQYASQQFRQFTREWTVSHCFSSPHYPQSNGLAEIMVKAVKNHLKKSNHSKSDIYKSLLALRNTPLACGQSPAQLLYNRTLRDDLPRITHHTTASKPIAKQRDLVHERKCTKQYYDRSATTTTSKFRQGQRVAVQDEHTREWTRRGQIVSYVHPRSFLVRMDKTGSILRRNQRFLRGLHAISVSGGLGGNNTVRGDETHDLHIMRRDETDSDSDSVPYDMDEDTAGEEVNKSEEKTRSRAGREIRIKVPLDYDDL